MPSERQPFGQTLLFDLSPRVKLRFAGQDRVRYLNGQVTSNVQKLGTGETQLACITTAKGKLCADIVISAEADALWVDAEPVLHESLPARLERYIISDDVTMHDATVEMYLLHGIGPVPETLGGKARAASRFHQSGWDVWLDADSYRQTLPILREHCQILDAAAAEAFRVERGVPRWGAELDENTLPPEAGLDRTHIDYHKGCYIGQEVISRLKSVGHVNRSLTGFAAAGPVQAGMLLFHSHDPAKECGILTSVAQSFTLEKTIALGYLKRGTPGGELIARADSSGAESIVTVHDLPFVS